MRLFPWSGFRYELRRALLSIPLIVVTVLIVLAAFGILATIAASQPPPSTYPEESGAYYFTGGQYYFEFYAYTQSGSSISGANFTLQVFPSNQTPGSPTTSIANASGVTGSTGLVSLALPLAGSNYTVLFDWTSPTGPNTIYGPGVFIPVARPPPGVVEPFNSGFTNFVQTVQRFLTTDRLLIFYPGPNGTAPPNYQIYWAAPPNATLPAAPLPESNMHRLGALTAAHQYFSLIVPQGSNPSRLSYLQVELFTTSGRLVATDTNLTASDFFPPAGGVAGTSVALGFGGTIMAYLVPLMAVLSAYSVYGKDRLTGVLEGVLARPVSRLGLATSRYLAVIVALCLAVTAAMASLDALIAWVYGGFLPFDVTLTLFAPLLVEVGAFTGITFVLSHALRSTGALVGIGLGIFALFSIGWLIIPNIIGGLTGTIFTPGYEHALIELEFLNPIQFLNLAETLFFGSVQSLLGSGIATAPSAYGISYGSVIGVGLAWVLAPAALLVYVVRYWD